MNLLEIRTQFAKISGRYDLVNGSFGDAGADVYINEGLRFLDRKLDYGPSVGKYYKDLTAGDFKVPLDNCRAILEVWTINSTSRTEVALLDEYELRSVYQRNSTYSTPLTTMERNRPLYYYPTNFRRVPDANTFSTDSATLLSYLDTTSPHDPTVNGIIIIPPPDTDYAIEVSGLFYSPKLTLDIDTNYWTLNHPNLLITAALRQLDIMYNSARNFRTFEESMATDLRDLEYDFISQSTTDAVELEG